MGAGFSAAAAVLVGAIAATVGPAEAELPGISALSWLVFGLVAALVLLTLGLARAGLAGRSLFRLGGQPRGGLAVEIVAHPSGGRQQCALVGDERTLGLACRSG